MARHAYVFAYDVSRDKARGKISGLLAEHLTRRQLSLFEGHLSTAEARRLAAAAAAHMGPEDTLNVYCLTGAGLKASFAHGRGALPEAQDFLLF
jgi:CRISPR-associated endonuclease Cas2